LNIIFGSEETLIAGLALGARAGLGGTLTCAGPIYRRLFEAYLGGDIQTARMEQARALELVEIFRRYGSSTATKAVMAMIGIDCGPPRQPLACLSHSQLTSLRNDLERIEFFDWIGPNHAQARKPLQRHHAGLVAPHARAA
jgi:N-acetylneuraminate lyase